MLLGYLNTGSNFNNISALLSQQSLFAFKAIGSNSQVAYITNEQFNELCDKNEVLQSYKKVVEEIYNESGKKYDFQRYPHRKHWKNGINPHGHSEHERIYEEELDDMVNSKMR